MNYAESHLSLRYADDEVYIMKIPQISILLSSLNSIFLPIVNFFLTIIGEILIKQ